MPYAPVLPPDFGPAYETYIANREVAQLISNAQTSIETVPTVIDVPSSIVAAEATGGVATLGTETAVAAATPPGATIAFVAISSYTLAQGIRQIPGWDNLWKHVGSDLVDGIFGLGAHEQVNSATKLYVADYVQHRFIVQRQREAAMNQLWASMHVREALQIQALGRDLARVNKLAHQADKDVLHSAAVHADAQMRAAIAYANARAHNVGVAAEQYAQRVGAANRTYAHNVAAQAQANAQRYTHDEIHSLEAQLPNLIAPAVAVAIATHLKPITQALSTLKDQVGKLQTENDECTEPMCETVGPKSDWGKLLKRFAPKAIFALLAVLAAEHPDEVANAAAELGSALGPVLEVAISSALIPLGSSPVQQPSDATGALGSLPFGL